MGRRNKGRRQFWESALNNNATYIQYYNRLTELTLSRFEWVNMPSTIDTRFLELTLFTDGQCVFFEDEVLGYLALQNAMGGKLSVYRVPEERRAYAVNGYQKQLTDKDSVLIYNNMLRTNSMLDIEMFASRLYNLDRIIDVNCNAQKTPILLTCDENERLTLENVYMQYDGNKPVIKGTKGINPQSLSVLSTDAPFVADKIYELKVKYWNEALTYLGITNISVPKKERMISDEVIRNQGGTVSSRFSPLIMRQKAANQINEMFGLNVQCIFRDVSQDAAMPGGSEENVDLYDGS